MVQSLNNRGQFMHASLKVLLLTLIQGATVVRLFSQGNLVIPREFDGSAGTHGAITGIEFFTELYAPVEFSSVGMNTIEISAMSFRLDETMTNQTFAFRNADIYMGLISAYNARHAIYDLKDRQLVFSHTVAPMVTHSGNGGLTAPFDITFVLDRSYSYAPSRGDYLVVEFPKGLGVVDQKRILLDASNYQGYPLETAATIFMWRQWLLPWPGELWGAGGYVTQFTFTRVTGPSVPSLAIARHGQGATLQIVGEIGRNYALEASSVLPAVNGWTSSPTFELINSPQAILETNFSGVQQFYRARLVP
jgi:hypothetical protein